MKENNINQVAMDIEENEVLEMTERKGMFARAKDKVQGFAENHPVIVKIGKVVVGGALIVGAYALGKASNAKEDEENDDSVEFMDMMLEDVEPIETAEE